MCIILFTNGSYCLFLGGAANGAGHRNSMPTPSNSNVASTSSSRRVYQHALSVRVPPPNNNQQQGMNGAVPRRNVSKKSSQNNQNNTNNNSTQQDKFPDPEG